MITRIVTDMKGRELEAIDLQLHTLIVGDSASGKSTITQAAELHVSGKMTDFQGRAESALRTVTGAIRGFESDDPPIIECVGESKRLLFREVKDAVTSSAFSALLQLTGTEASEYLAYAKKVREGQTEVRKLTECRKTLESLEGDALRLHGKEVWGALEERSAAAAREVETAQSECQRLQLALFPGIAKAIGELSELAAPFVPKPLGRLAINPGTDERPDCTVQLSGRSALSGSEWNIALTAIASAMARDDSDLIIPDDRAIDLVLLEDWMRVLEQSKAQVMLTVVGVRQKGVPESWHVVKLHGSRYVKPPQGSESASPT